MLFCDLLDYVLFLTVWRFLTVFCSRVVAVQGVFEDVLEDSMFFAHHPEVSAFKHSAGTKTVTPLDCDIRTIMSPPSLPEAGHIESLCRNVNFTFLSTLDLTPRLALCTVSIVNRDDDPSIMRLTKMVTGTKMVTRKPAVAPVVTIACYNSTADPVTISFSYHHSCSLFAY